MPPLLHPDSLPTSATVLLADGDFPRHPTPLSALRTAHHLVCCDGAASALALHEPSLLPDAIVGDFDSLPTSLFPPYPSDRFFHVTEQETNDLSKAFRFAQSHAWDNLILLGATGKREDHTLGNIALLADFVTLTPTLRMITDYGTFLPLQGPAQICCGAGRPISLFSFDPTLCLTSTGLQYPLHEFRLTPFWSAILNRSTSDILSLTPSSNAPYLVYLAHPEKGSLA